MHQVFRSALLLLLVAPPAVAQRDRTEMSPNEIVREVTDIRLLWLEDSTPVDFCALPELFGQDGVLPRDPKQPRAAYATLRDCASASPESKTPPRVEVMRRSVVGDTVVIHGVTNRGGLSLIEEYRFFQRGEDRHWVPRYRIVAFVER